MPKVNAFSGLKISQDPSDIGLEQAADGANFDLRSNGRVGSRPGYAKFTAAAAAGRYTDLWLFWGANQIIAQRSGNTDVLDSTGAVVNTTAQQGLDWTEFGGTLGAFMYGTRSGGTLMEWSSGLGFNNVAGSPTALRISSKPGSNRLVVGSVGANLHRLEFSAAGNPASWPGFTLDVDPNDGTTGITALARWRTLLFAFKSRRFYTFHDEGQAGNGNPIFNYNTVDVGIGTTSQSVAVAPEGIYFRGYRGIYLTAGGLPVCVSDDISPVFQQYDALGEFTGSRCSQSWETDELAYADGRLYVAVTRDGSSTRDIWVYYTETRQWTYWTGVPAGGLVWHPQTGHDEILFTYAAGTNDLGVLGGSRTTDAGASIASSYRGGWVAPNGDAEVDLMESTVWGTGDPILSIFTAPRVVDPLATALSLGAGVSVRGLDRQSRRGRLFSYGFSGTAPWTINDLDLRF